VVWNHGSAGQGHAPALLGADIDPAADTRKVNYWITMSLPTFWTRPPADAKPQEIYVYRPDYFQDEDGIARRITLWFNPNARSSLAEILGNSSSAPGKTSNTATAPAGPATVAMPAAADSDQEGNPFRSPIDDSSRPSGPSRAMSTKNPAPSGTNTLDTPIPSPLTHAPSPAETSP
jgi:hypothetical protein